ncbi:hypothetical protein [Lentzea sp. NPDC051838]|uniref:hypothetical protein n=1 Tax=Lentzea sp. NPDC051838 TaxID=3154849 RepID=UPI00342D01C5
MYIWMPRSTKRGRFGHSAIETSRAYVSFWPKDSEGGPRGKLIYIANRPGYAGDSLHGDIEYLKYRPDHTIHLKYISGKKIRKRWKRIRSGDFNLAFNNCSTVVSMLLSHALQTDKISFWKKFAASPRMRFYNETDLVDTPRRVLEYCRILKSLE